MWAKCFNTMFKFRKTLKKYYKETKRAQVWNLEVDYNKEISWKERKEIGQ